MDVIDLDTSVVNNLRSWLSTRLACLPGRREFNQRRFEFYVIESDNELIERYRLLIAKLSTFDASGCLFVFPSISSAYDKNIEDVFADLSDKIIVLTGNSSGNGFGNAQINKSLTLRCAVTDQLVEYHDFDFVAFCPQANNKSDRLYNPSIEAPYPSVNFTSDIFGFSLFVRDMSMKFLGCAPNAIKDSADRDQLFIRCTEMWQNLALKTMHEYASRTDANLICPIHVSESKTHWISTHSDSAFASLDPHLYVQELPKSYAPRIIAKWQRWFSHGEPIDLSDVSASDILYLPASHRPVSLEDR